MEGDPIVNIGIIGAGNVGTGLAKHLIQNGHAVMLSFSLDMDKLIATAAELGARVGTVAEAVQFADMVVLNTPWTVTSDALGQTASVQGKKIMWDCTNALKPDLSGLAIGTTTSGAEEIAKLAPWATVVKAIPPFAQMLHSPSMLIGEHRPNVFVCGDDADARAVIARLVDEIDAGPLALARCAEPAAMLLVQLAYQQGFGTRSRCCTSRRAARLKARVPEHGHRRGCMT
jgi:8-hydroxy-5-deazaflavin:NADPH oxidoreductase